MSLKIYINGEFLAKEDAKISVYDHGLLYGDGVFEGLRVYSGKIFREQRHLDRLWESAKAIWLEIPLTKEQVAAAMHQALSLNNIQDGYIRLVVTRGAGTLGIDPNRTQDPQVIVIADSIALYPDELYRDGMKIVTASTVRTSPAALSPRIKSLNYLNNIMAKIEGMQAGCLEALMLNHKGEVAECTADNVFAVKSKALLTPPTDAGILAGVTREAIMEVATGAGYEVREQSMTRHDVYVADEFFLTGTAAEVMPVVKVDDRIIGTGKPGPVTCDLRERFQSLVRSS